MPEIRTKIMLGDRVRDIVTGLEGVALAVKIGLYENTQFRVHHESLTNDGNMRNDYWVDEGRLKIIGEAKKSRYLNGFYEVNGKRTETDGTL